MSLVRFLRAVLAPCALVFLIVALPGCSYTQQRAADAGDIFYVSGGPTVGVSMELFISFMDTGIGYHVPSHVFGWEGRGWLHRQESFTGLLFYTVTVQRDLSLAPLPDHLIPGPQHTESARLPSKPIPYVNRRFIAVAPSPFTFIYLADTFSPPGSEAVELAPDTYMTDETTADWGWGIAATPGFFTIRLGMRPGGLMNFLTGWFGFHLFYPYESLSNDILPDAMRMRGLLWPDAKRDPVKCLLAQLPPPERQEDLARYYSIKMLGSMGPAAKPYLPNLLPLLSDNDPIARLNAAIAVHRIDPTATSPMQTVRALLNSEYWSRFAKAALIYIQGK